MSQTRLFLQFKIAIKIVVHSFKIRIFLNSNLYNYDEFLQLRRCRDLKIHLLCRGLFHTRRGFFSNDEHLSIYIYFHHFIIKTFNNTLGVSKNPSPTMIFYEIINPFYAPVILGKTRKQFPMPHELLGIFKIYIGSEFTVKTTGFLG